MEAAEDDDLEQSFNACADKAAQRCVEDAAQRLSEHYDSVRIICVKHTQGQTAIYSSGRGNLYSQHGSVRDWMMRQDEYLKKHVREDD